MTSEPPVATGFVAECFWAGVTEDEVRAVDARTERSATAVTRGGSAVRFLGSILMRDDEVVLFVFEGTAEAVRRAAEQAEIPFERILESTHSRWPDIASAFHATPVSDPSNNKHEGEQ